MSQRWPLSQNANKRKGVCSVCRAVRQLKGKDGTVHRHGHRDNPCPGSDLAPLSVVDNTGAEPAPCNSSARNCCPAVAASDTCQVAATSPPSSSLLQLNPTTAADDSPAALQLFMDMAGAPVPVIKHIPKSARPACASLLTQLIRSVIANPNDLDVWLHLLCWCRLVLISPKRGGQRNCIASTIKRRVAAFDSLDLSVDGISPSAATRSSSFNLADAVRAKLEDGNMSAAVRLISSDDAPTAFNQETFQLLKEKHPSAPTYRASLPDSAGLSALTVEESHVKRAIQTFPPGSSGGLDGLRPQHLKDLINCVASGAQLLSALTEFVNLLLSGVCHPQVVPILFGGRLIALNKKSGGIRPIAVGNTLRRLTAKCANTFATAKLAPVLSPRQIGVGVAGGCEAAVHAVRRFVAGAQQGDIVVKLDFSNAFNSIRRDVMLQAVFDYAPELYKFCSLAYSRESFLKFGSFVVSSQEGVQQGDPLGPLLFCISIHNILGSLSSLLSVGYLDDLTLGGSVDAVSHDVELILSEGPKLGLCLNVDKCELICLHSPLLDLPDCLSNFARTEMVNATLLGAPLFVGKALDDTWANQCDVLSHALARLSLVCSHDALLLLRACFSSPKVLHLLRCSPSFDHASLISFDNLLKVGLCNILNCNLSETQWLQASLPVKDGGLGIRSVAALAPSAFLASAAGTANLQEILLTPGGRHLVSDVYVDASAAIWSTLSGVQVLDMSTTVKQSVWDRPIVDAIKGKLWANVSDDLNLTRLSAVSAPHSGDWLFAMPISSCGLRLDDEAVRVSAGLRLGVNLCVQHACPCGAVVDCTGTHGLSCRLACGRQARHHAVNDIIFRAMCSAGVPSTKEPAGLVRDDGKRPDGLSLIPWTGGKPVTWDVTVVDPLAKSYVQGAQRLGGAAEQAAARKISKYSQLSASYIFQPLAFECLGAMNASASEFLGDLGHRLALASGERKAGEFLFQRISITVQRFNAVAFRGSFPVSSLDDADE